jgi:streptogramin lyase
LFEWNRKSGTFKHYRSEDKTLFCNEIFDIARDAQGNLWLATIQGVERFDPRSKRSRHFKQPLPFNQHDDKILSVEAAPDGRIWQGSNRGKLIVTDPATGRNEWIPLRQHDGSEFSNYGAWNIEIDHRGRILAPSPNGLLRYDPATKTNDHILYRTPMLTTLDAVSGLDQRLYVATVEGVYVLDERDSLLFVLDAQNGLRNQVVKHIDVDRQGNIWIATTNGLHRYEPSSGKIDYFSKADGLFLSNLTEGFSVLPNGELFVSGNYSFNLLPFDERQRSAPPPRITLEGIKVLEKYVEWEKGQTLRLRPGENVFTFDIALIQFTQSDKSQLSHRLEGFNENWTDWTPGRRNTITFTNLDAGNYTLHVRARNGDGVWSEETLEIPVEVIPPFYETWWFYGLCALLLFGVAFGIYRYRHNVRLRIEIMQARAVALERQQLLNEIALLKTQVNPHFLFNSLSILSSLVHVNADLSEQFIDQLSRSYRYILEQKDQSLVTIRTELEFIRSYVFLLKIRFENKLDLNIQLAENELDKYKIAPLTLQLLVENAVKHNRMSNKEPLLISVVQQGDWLEVRNPFRPRGEAVDSTGTGLQNIINRYALLTDRPVWAGECEDQFLVKIPLLDGETADQQGYDFGK